MAGLTANRNDITLAGRMTLAQILRGGMLRAPVITPQGTAGTTAYGYKVEAITVNGEIPLSPEGQTATGNATLSPTNHNRIEWATFNGATGYNIYRTAAAGTPATTGLIGTTTALFLADTGLTVTGPIPQRMFGISHMSIGTGTPTTPPFGLNYQVGNSFQMDPVASGGTLTAVTLHNDFPVYNFTVNGVPNAFYFIEVNNTQQDKSMSFISDPPLQQNKFNHLFLTPIGSSGPFGLGQIVIEATNDAAVPTMGSSIIYLGYIQCDNTILSAVTATRMFNEIDRILPDELDFMHDKYLQGYSAGSLTGTGSTTKNLLVTGRFGPGISDTVREVAIFANDGQHMLAYAGFLAIPVTLGQRLRLRWRLAF